MIALLLVILLVNCKISAIYSEKLDQLRGLHFRLSAFHIPPFLYIERKTNGNISYRGIVFEVMDWMFSEQSGSSYEFVQANKSQIAARGYIQSSIDLLVNGEVDVATLGYIPTAERLQFMEFSVSCMIEQFRLLVPYPQEESRLLGPIRPFQSEVWILFLVSTAAFIVALSLLSHYFNDQLLHVTRKSFGIHLSDNAVYTVTLLIGNAESYPFKTLAIRILLSIWCLMCVIIINSYTGNLTSYLAIPALKPIPNSFDELAARNDLHFIVDHSSVLAQQILEAKSGPFKVLGDGLRKYPHHLYKTLADYDKLLLTYRMADPGMTTFVYNKIFEEFKKSGKCDFTSSKPLPYYQSFSAGLPKNGPYNKLINFKLQYIWEMGLMKYWQSKFIPRVDQCLLDNKERPRNARLKLLDLSSAFLLLACGFGLSLLIFIAEISSQMQLRVRRFFCNVATCVDSFFFH